MLQETWSGDEKTSPALGAGHGVATMLQETWSGDFDSFFFAMSFLLEVATMLQETWSGDSRSGWP